MKSSQILKLLGMALFISMAALPFVQGHGYLAVPAARNAKWTCGFPESPPDYGLTGLSAGGPATVRGARLGHGVCGDSVRGNQPHLEGGLYTRDQLITGKYRPNEEFEVTVEVTVYHSGWFSFYLCPIGQTNENWDMEVTQECLDQYPLERADGHGVRYYINSGSVGTYQIRLKMPDVECERCVLQYYWQTANSGCSQNTEEFWNCADISIKSSYSRSDIGPTSDPGSSCYSGAMVDTSHDNGCPGYKCPRDFDPDGFISYSPCIGPSPNPWPENPPQESSSSSSSSNIEPSSSSSSSPTPPPPSSSSSMEMNSSERQEESSSDINDNPSITCRGKTNGNYCYGPCSDKYYTCVSGRMFPNRSVPPGIACNEGRLIVSSQC
eukprot:gb/GECH01007137.1/.p1 GENE.gb/GECH01007137.1/~~gb/GECH01007137.1/.p1  ORF type:complete len:381 (+),score=84.01 gb/GECH01007137.1/:1-1143(+)